MGRKVGKKSWVWFLCLMVCSRVSAQLGPLCWLLSSGQGWVRTCPHLVSLVRMLLLRVSSSGQSTSVRLPPHCSRKFQYHPHTGRKSRVGMLCRYACVRTGPCKWWLRCHSVGCPSLVGCPLPNLYNHAHTRKKASVMYQRRLLLTSSLLMVLYTEISELYCTSFRLAFGQ